MNQHFPLKPLYYALGILTVFSTLYVLSVFGLLENYAHFFGKTHPHKWHTLFRMCFVIAFAVVNHWFLVPRLYISKRYIFFFAIVFVCLVALMILPDIIITPPKLERPQFEQSKLFDGHPPPFPFQTLLFELIHVYLLFFIATFTSIAVRTRQYIQQIERHYEQQSQASEIIEHQKETTEERDIETALTVTVNYSLVRLTFSEILFIKSMGNYLHFFLKDKKPVLVRMTLKEALEKLPNEGFLRVHKSYIVAVALLENIRNKMILINDQEIPIGRVYEETVFKVFAK
jgi:LytTr DNA-binding domain